MTYNVEFCRPQNFDFCKRFSSAENLTYIFPRMRTRITNYSVDRINNSASPRIVLTPLCRPVLPLSRGLLVHRRAWHTDRFGPAQYYSLNFEGTDSRTSTCGQLTTGGRPRERHEHRVRENIIFNPLREMEMEKTVHESRYVE